MRYFLNNFADYTVCKANYPRRCHLDSRPYYGGISLPTMNAVLEFGLVNEREVFTAFRKVQNKLTKQELGIDFGSSFTVFDKGVVIYDLSNDVPFDRKRLQGVLEEEGV